jgi:lysozyme
MKRRLLALLPLPLVGCVATTVPPEPTASTEQATTVCGQTSVKGADVSHYDGTVDWTQAKAAGISFGFAKATESTDFVDPQFAANWSGMKAAGIARGAYHFFHPEVDATQQADYVVKTVGTLEAGDLPIVCDLEQTGSQSEADILADAITFLAAVTTATGKTAVLYVSPSFLSSYAGLESYGLWIANWGVTCPTVPSPWTTWAFWQNSDTGTVSGISGTGAVDLDVFNGTLAQLTGGSSGSSSGSGSGSGSGSSSGSSSGSGSGSGSSSGGSSGSGSSSGGTGSSSGGSTGSSSSGGGSGGSSGSGSSTSGSSSGGSSGGITTDGGGSSSGGSGGDAGWNGDAGSNGGGCSVGRAGNRDDTGALAFAGGLLALVGYRGRRARRSRG